MAGRRPSCTRDAQNGTSEFLRAYRVGASAAGEIGPPCPPYGDCHNFCLLAAFCGRVFCSTGHFLQLPAPFVRRLSSASQCLGVS
jgi:hypothetical protein